MAFLLSVQLLFLLNCFGHVTCNHDNKRIIYHSDYDVMKIITALQAEVVGFKSKTAALESKVSALEINATASENKITALESDATASQNKITALESDATASQNKTTALESDATASQNKITALESDATASQNNIIALESDATASQNKIIALESDATASQNKITALESDATASQNNIIALESDATASQNKIIALESDATASQNKITALESKLKSMQTTMQSSGVTYVRWGRTTCPSNGTEFIYRGYMAGADYTQSGGGANNLCLPEDPTWSKYVDGYSSGAVIYGTEIELDSHVSSTIFGKQAQNQDIPCAVCRSSRASHVMLPARANCYSGWTQEYSGYLIAAYSGHNKADYVCLDSDLEFARHGAANDNDHTMRVVEIRCGNHGSLPCPPFVEGRELSCVVFTK